MRIAAVLTTIHGELVKTAAICKCHSCETSSIAAPFRKILSENDFKSQSRILSECKSSFRSCKVANSRDWAQPSNDETAHQGVFEKVQMLQKRWMFPKSNNHASASPNAFNTPTTTAKRPMPTRAHSLKHYARHGPQWAHPCDHHGRIRADIPTRTRVFNPNQALIPDTPCGTSDQSVRPARLLARQIKQARSSKNRAAEKVAAARNRHSARQPRRGFRLQLFEPGMPDFSIPIRQAQSSS